MKENVISEEARKLRNEYYRKWRKENKDRVSAANKRYRESHKSEIAKTYNNFWEKKVAESKRATNEECE